MVIEADGISFLAERVVLPLVSGLKVKLGKRYGRDVLVLSHETHAPHGSC